MKGPLMIGNIKLKMLWLGMVIAATGLAGCAALPFKPQCYDVQPVRLFLDSGKVARPHKFTNRVVDCPTVILPPIETGGNGSNHVPPAPGPVQPTPTAQGSVAGGGVAAAVEGAQSSYAGGGRAGADDGLGPIDVAALRPKS